MNENGCLRVALACLFALGCGSSADGPDEPDTPGPIAAGGAGSCPTSGDSLVGSGTVSGAVKGASFAEVANSLWIGAPDSDASTVVFLFSKPVACSELCSPGWDARIGNGTQILELKALGLGPGTFRVVKTSTPAPGEAVVNATLSSTHTAAAETTGNAGTLTLSLLHSQQPAEGTFDLQFGSDRLSGSFSAAFCPQGHEP